MNYEKLVLILLVGWVLNSCAGAPKVTVCTIINKDIAHCKPPKRSDKPVDKPIKKMLGFQCLSPEDVGEIRKALKNATENLYDLYLE